MSPPQLVVKGADGNNNNGIVFENTDALATSTGQVSKRWTLQPSNSYDTFVVRGTSVTSPITQLTVSPATTGTNSGTLQLGTVSIKMRIFTSACSHNLFLITHGDVCP